MRRGSTARSFFLVPAVDQPPRLAFAAEIGAFAQRAVLDQIDGDLEAKIGQQPLLQIFLQTLDRKSVV